MCSLFRTHLIEGLRRQILTIISGVIQPIPPEYPFLDSLIART